MNTHVQSIKMIVFAKQGCNFICTVTETEKKAPLRVAPLCTAYTAYPIFAPLEILACHWGGG